MEEKSYRERLFTLKFMNMRKEGKTTTFLIKVNFDPSFRVDRIKFMTALFPNITKWEWVYSHQAVIELTIDKSL